jgi:hypothetical protein
MDCRPSSRIIRAAATPERVTIDEAVEAFLVKCKGRDIELTTLDKY